MLTNIRALADHFLTALPNINTLHVGECDLRVTTSNTTPQPQNSDVSLIAIGGYSDAPSVAIDLLRHLIAAAESGVGIEL